MPATATSAQRACRRPRGPLGTAARRTTRTRRRRRAVVRADPDRGGAARHLAACRSRRRPGQQQRRRWRDPRRPERRRRAGRARGRGGRDRSIAPGGCPTLLVAVAWVFSMVVFANVVFGGHTYHVSLYEWIGSGELPRPDRVPGRRSDRDAAAGGEHGRAAGPRLLDRLHGRRPGLWRFFAYLNLFMFSMLLLILGDNFLMLYVGWEAVGLCSYALIGFWYKKPSAAGAAKKAFIVNRVGDFGFGLGIMMIWTLLGTLTSPRSSPGDRRARAVADHRDRACCCSPARWARARSSRCTSGCPTRWKGRRRSAP